ncbi:MAG: protein translocase subunit SecF [Parcubacteria group bacterium]|nr:protein translocase subunit SecF [Parcubacteria group bacterium]
MFVIRHKTLFFSISGAFVAFALFAMLWWGLNPSIEFSGGVITEVNYVNARPDVRLMHERLTAAGFSDALVQEAGERGYIIRARALAQDERSRLISALSAEGRDQLVEERYSLVGPSIGAEMKRKAWIAIGAVALAIILYLAFAFRKASGAALGEEETIRVRGWHYGAVAVVALLHDVIIPTGLFAFLGSRFIDAQIDALFVMALLAILGYSVNDTIVVFDRVRDNLRRNHDAGLEKPFEETVGESLNQSYGRSLNTSLTTLFALLALYFIGSAATQNFALVLSIGVIAGTWSSLFLAAPLLALMGRPKDA